MQRRDARHIYGRLICFFSDAQKSFAQEKSLKEQLVGAWTIVSVSSKLPDGTLVWGTDLIGLIIFTSDGHYSTQLIAMISRNMRRTIVRRALQKNTEAIAMGSVRISYLQRRRSKQELHNKLR